jgi:3-methyladenine DNA glycosylase AlkD
MADLEQIRAELYSLKNLSKAEQSKRYLKSPYNFYGITVPELRKIAKKYRNLDIYSTFNLFDELWNSNNHEEMSLALYLLGNHKKNFNLEFWDFLKKENRIIRFKTWDHVDEASSHIFGEILVKNPHLNSEIKQMADSKNPWIRRIAIVSQYPSIKKGKIQFTILLAEKLVYDEDIYVQKAAGWMLREAAKKNEVQVKEFLKIHKDMKPAALSYATEKMLEFRKQLKEKLKDEKENGKTQVFPDGSIIVEDSKNPKSSINPELKKIKYFKN